MKHPKSKPVRDKSYLRRVAQLPCAHCGIEGYSQAAHADEGKGMGIKSSDCTAFPLCGPHPRRDFSVSLGVYEGWSPGCHWAIGSSGYYSREERRALEQKYGKQTRELLQVAEPEIE